MIPCPNRATLRLIGTEALDVTPFPELEAHVEQCGDCQAFLEELVRDSWSDFPQEAEGQPAADVFPTIPGLVIERELGRGSAGVVYLAGEPGLERSVALKVVPGGLAAGPRGQARWLAEARAVSRIRHPNVVRLYRVEKTSEWLVLVLEHIPGGTLKERLTGPLAPGSVAALVETLSLAVDHIHQFGLVHLDLKPSNILLDGEPGAALEAVVPKISDFGIARSDGDATATDGSPAGPRGTPSYMAPEQAMPSGAGIGPAADVYALGAILYHGLTGRPPFQAASVIETLDQIRRQDPSPPRLLNPRVPRDLETICLVCLRKGSNERYPTARALAEDLRRWLEGRPIAARRASPLDHAWRWCRRRPMTAALLAGFALTVLGSSLGLAVLLEHSNAETRQAEAARRTAQANFRVASTSLKELLLPTNDIDEYSDLPRHWTDAERKVLETARAQELELRRKNPGDLDEPRRLAKLDSRLASVYMSWSRFAEGRALLRECIDLWDAIGPDGPASAEAAFEELKAVLTLCRLLESPQNDLQLKQYYKKASTLTSRLRTSPDHPTAIVRLLSLHRDKANELGQLGLPERARRWLEGDLELLDSVPSDETQTPELLLSRMLTLTALGRSPGDLTHLRKAVQARTRRPGLRIDITYGLPELVAWQVGWMSLGETAKGLAAVESPVTWAHGVLRTIQEQASALDLTPALVPWIAWTMHHRAASAAAQARKRGDLDHARRVAVQIQALAEQTINLYPDQPDSYLLLGEAYIQMAKNAWKTGDFDAIEQFTRQGLDASRHALALEPEREDLRRLVEDRRRRMDGVIAKRGKSSQSVHGESRSPSDESWLFQQAAP